MATHPINDLLRRYLSNQRAPRSLELGDTAQEHTVGYQDDRRRIPVRHGCEIAGKQALADFLFELLKEEKRK
jgi:hypothetical protein